MSGWTEIEVGSVKLKHHSTSSLIEMTVTTEEVLYQDKGPQTVVMKRWFEYAEFDDLLKAVKKTEE